MCSSMILTGHHLSTRSAKKWDRITKNSLDKKLQLQLYNYIDLIISYAVKPPLISHIIHCQKPRMLDHRLRLDANNRCKSVSVLTKWLTIECFSLRDQCFAFPSSRFNKHTVIICKMISNNDNVYV